MKTNTNIEHDEYVPEMLSKLTAYIEEINKLQKKADDMSEQIVIDITDGWSTGDQALDFALIACDGNYNPYVLEQYRQVADLGLRNPNNRILVVQVAESWWGEDTVLIRNIYFAQLNAKATIFDIDSMSIHIPVHTGYLLWRESIEDGELSSECEKIDDTWIKVGLLRGEYLDYALSVGDDDSSSYVPLDSPCEIELLPVEHKDDLLEKYAIDNGHLDLLERRWREYNIQ
ncbi:hypothetical protein KC850_04375 [Candidatus Kaiserbacteria bacterium]|nr:hypothetical protein [Candidatus Kaiserbacteria bacterium]